MKISFGQIKKQLEDPFFELRTLGKNAIRERIQAITKYGEVPDNFSFISWETEDNQETIQYAFHDTGIGRLLIANTTKGVCFLGFACKGDTEIKEDFISRFPGQQIIEKVSELQLLAVQYCNGNHDLTIPLHMKGTAFQAGIWKQLVRIPEGMLSTYSSLTNEPGTAQAVGAAVGANPVSYIVPCHRVVRSDGNIQGYHWGTDIKKLLLAYELQPGEYNGK
ncbi:MAG: methylated-DNA--[protein]-cysteine S-methyltransferase [Tannerellaceae bacterium]|nr:methylated-DNA--[protein]-cysteine S-methyltransferase [Tannerellaceae bacterium]